MSGELSVLNCRAGDLKFSFDSANPIEVERARRVVADMLKRGYALFVDVGGTLRKVTAFDESTNSYIIADGPLYAGDAEPPQSRPSTQSTLTVATQPRKPGRPPKKSIPARSHKAIAIAPTAGG